MEVPGPTALWLCRRYVLRLLLSRFRLPAKKPFPKGVKIPVQSLDKTNELTINPVRINISFASVYMVIRDDRYVRE